MPAHPNSLANLRPPWKQGYAPNPGGRKKGVVYPVEYLRSMGGMTQAELERVRDDPEQPINRRAAAEMALQTIDPKGTRKDRREAFSEMADRTTGKPRQDIHLQAKAKKEGRMLIAQIKQRYARQLRHQPPDHLPGVADLQAKVTSTRCR